jgi:hypothetical protein
MIATFSRWLQTLGCMVRKPLARYLIDELLAPDNGLAGRLCRLRMGISWPLIAGRLAGSGSRVGSVSFG